MLVSEAAPFGSVLTISLLCCDSARPQAFPLSYL